MAASTNQSSNFGWLVTDFVRRVPDASHAVMVAADGLMLARSADLPKDQADQMAAVASGVLSLTVGAARCFEAGSVNQIVIQMELGHFLLMSISDGSCLAVWAGSEGDIGTIAYEMTLLVDRVSRQLTPELRTQLRGVFQRGA